MMHLFMQTIADISELPRLAASDLHIWGVHVPGAVARLAELEAVLAPAERDKAARFRRIADRQSSVAARGALRILLSGYTGTPADAIAFDYSENGKPHVAGSDVDFNVSHSGDWAVLAFGRNRRIGVDIEKIRREVEVAEIAARYFTAEEQGAVLEAPDAHTAFFTFWAKKEAYVKASGSTLFRELGRVTVPSGDSECRGWHFYRLEAGSGYAAAVVTDRAAGAISCYDFGGLQWRN